MHKEVKRYADSGDIKGLRYIFVDCLDVDPTFEKYKEDYKYCKNLNGLFEAHKELTPLSMNKSSWNDDYWQKLKMDLLDNFSDKRFKHMIQVAQVVYADKIKRLLKERENSVGMQATKVESTPSRISTSVKRQSKSTSSKTFTVHKSLNENHTNNSEMESIRNKYDEEYKKQIRKEKEDEERRRRRRQQLSQQQANKDSNSKKIMGVVVAGAAVILLAILAIKELT